mmetsp:Transcript_34245/g.94308  ORF Transcript_34245/g.94308 Transcript_34245/m.94308 type:complete len:240 (-) Transcript_34245:1053-1772(-)
MIARRDRKLSARSVRSSSRIRTSGFPDCCNISSAARWERAQPTAARVRRGSKERVELVVSMVGQPFASASCMAASAAGVQSWASCSSLRSAPSTAGSRCQLIPSGSSNACIAWSRSGRRLRLITITRRSCTGCIDWSVSLSSSARTSRNSASRAVFSAAIFACLPSCTTMLRPLATGGNCSSLAGRFFTDAGAFDLNVDALDCRLLDTEPPRPTRSFIWLVASGCVQPWSPPNFLWLYR